MHALSDQLQASKAETASKSSEISHLQIEIASTKAELASSKQALKECLEKAQQDEKSGRTPESFAKLTKEVSELTAKIQGNEALLTKLNADLLEAQGKVKECSIQLERLAPENAAAIAHERSRAEALQTELSKCKAVHNIPLWSSMEFVPPSANTPNTPENVADISTNRKQYNRALLKNANNPNKFLDIPSLSTIDIPSSIPHEQVTGLNLNKGITNKLYGGNLEDDADLFYGEGEDKIFLFDLPFKWRKEHNDVYHHARDTHNNLLKILSINQEKIKTILTDQLDKENLILSSFIDITKLINYYEFNKSSHPDILLLKNIEKEYQKLISKIPENYKLISKLQPFTHVRNFVLVEDLINFYRIWTNSYIVTKTSEFNYETDTTFLICMIELYKNWNYYRLNRVIPLIIKLNDGNLPEKIESLYNQEKNEPIKTYLRIRCDTKPKYNEYFNIYIEPISDDHLKSIYIAGPDVNLQVPFHKENGINEAKENGKNVTNIVAYGEEEDKLKGSLKKINKYDYGYLYGPFTKIFDQNQTNESISKNCTEIIDTLKNGKSAFVIGYGASGAGKTSSLIYWTQQKDEGIILRLCKLLETDEITVSVHELFSDQEPEIIEKTQQEKIIINTHAYDDILFVKDPSKKFVISKTQTSSSPKSNSYNQITKIEQADSITWEPKNYTWKIENGKFTHTKNLQSDNTTPVEVTELGDFIATLVDTVRMVKPTPNNPQSSRSHVLVFLKMNIKCNDGQKKDVTLIIGDFAGVENKFICDDASTKANFLKLIPEKTDKNPYPPPYYVKGEYKKIDIQGDENQQILEKKILKYFGYTDINSIEKLTQKSIDAKIKRILDMVAKYKLAIEKPTSDFLQLEKDITAKLQNFISNRKAALIDYIKQKYPLKLQQFIKLIDSQIKKSDYKQNEYDQNFPINNVWSSYSAKADKGTVIDGSFIIKDLINNPNKTLNSYYIDLYNEIYDINFIDNYLKWTDTTGDITSKNLIPIYPYITYVDGIAEVNARFREKYKDTTNLKSNRLNIEKYQKAKLEITDMQKIIEEFSTSTGSVANYKTDLQDLLNPKTKYDIIYKYTILEFFSEMEIPEKINLNNITIQQINQYKTYFDQIIKTFIESSDRIFKELTANISLLNGDIQNRCKERTNEGIFINKSLFGMRKDLIEIINNNQRDALLQKIPLFNSDCLDYYCSKDTYDCFNLVQHLPEFNDDNNSNIIKTIMDTIKLKIPDPDQLKKLSIIIFGIINITQGKNDPPKMPYINLNKLKILREKIINDIKFKETYMYRKLSIEEKRIKNLEYTKILDEITSFKDDSIIILKNFKDAIGEPLINLVERTHLSFTNETDINEKYNKLVNFIDVFEEINSTSILGTIDFLQSMKNTFHTDNSCSIVEDINNAKILNLRQYINIIIPTKTLADDLHHNVLSGGSLKKQQLIKEYKRLMKLYIKN